MRHYRYTIVQKPGSLGRKSAEDGVILIESRSECFLVRGERIHGETLTVDARCSSGKDAYPTYAAAERVLRMRSLNGKRTKRIYKCEECGYYHFTTNDGTARKPRPYRRGREKKYARMQINLSATTAGTVIPEGFSMKRFQNGETRRVSGW